MTHDAVTLRAKRLRRMLTIPLAVLASLVFVLVLLVLFVPTMDGPEHWISVREARTAATMRTLNDLEKTYASAHPEKGFSCELPTLRSTSANNLLESVWTTGTRDRYQFSLINCRIESTGAALHYQLVATPVEPGKSGRKAFCSDETGIIRYDKGGSATNCFEKGTAIN